MARYWVDCFNYQSNTVIIAALVLRGRPQPVHKACHVSDRLFLCEATKQACLIEWMSVKKGNETRSGSLKSFE
jgi:hypothetical protein